MGRIKRERFEWRTPYQIVVWLYKPGPVSGIDLEHHQFRFILTADGRIDLVAGAETYMAGIQGNHIRDLFPKPIQLLQPDSTPHSFSGTDNHI